MPDDIVRHIFEEFDKQPTPAIIAFELVVIFGTVALLWLLRRWNARVLAHYGVIATGVLIFEVFTAPMWDNFKLGVWGYVYKDVSWILTLGWSSLIIGTVFMVDRARGHWPEWQRFLAYLVVLTVITAAAEAVVVALGIRSYAPEVMEVARGSYVLGGALSLHLLYYVPVFMSLVIAFYKYWVPVIERWPEARARTHWLRSLVIAAVGVFFFEIMIEPMVENRNFPQWSYVYRDISVVMTAFWVVLIWIATYAVDRLLPRVRQSLRFAAYLIVLGIVATPIEAWFINSGYRVYGPSATANFIGIRTAWTDIPIEVALAIPLYLALIITFVRYWERITAPGAAEAMVTMPAPRVAGQEAAP